MNEEQEKTEDAIVQTEDKKRNSRTIMTGIFIAALLVLGLALFSRGPATTEKAFIWDDGPVDQQECHARYGKGQIVEAGFVALKACEVLFREATVTWEKEYAKCLLTGLHECEVGICVQALSDNCANKYAGQ